MNKLKEYLKRHKEFKDFMNHHPSTFLRVYLGTKLKWYQKPIIFSIQIIQQLKEYKRKNDLKKLLNEMIDKSQ